MGGGGRGSCPLGLPARPTGTPHDLAGDWETNRESGTPLVPSLIFAGRRLWERRPGRYHGDHAQGVPALL